MHPFGNWPNAIPISNHSTRFCSWRDALYRVLQNIGRDGGGPSRFARCHWLPTASTIVSRHYFVKISRGSANSAPPSQSGKTGNQFSICTAAFAILSGKNHGRPTPLYWSGRQRKESAARACSTCSRKTKLILAVASRIFGRNLPKTAKARLQSHSWYRTPPDYAHLINRPIFSITTRSSARLQCKNRCGHPGARTAITLALLDF